MVSVMQHFNCYVYAKIIAYEMQWFMARLNTVYVLHSIIATLWQERDAAMPLMKLLEVSTLTTIMKFRVKKNAKTHFSANFHCRLKLCFRLYINQRGYKLKFTN